MNELDSLVESAQQLFAQAHTPADLENAKAQFLGLSLIHISLSSYAVVAFKFLG